MEIIKTKVCKPDRRLGYYTLNYVEGIDVVYDTINVAIYYNLIAKAGSWYRVLDDNGKIMNYDGQELNFQGIARLTDFLNNNPDLYRQLQDRVSDAMLKD